MESMNNIFKGYDKVDNPLEHPKPNNRRRRQILIAASSALFLTFIIAAVIGAVVHESATESPDSEENHPSKSTNSEVSLKTVCAVTQHPDSCFTSISSLNNPPQNDPIHFFNLSLHYNLQDLKNISSFPQTLIPRSNDPGTESALHDCVNLFIDSVSQINQTVELISMVGPGEKMFTEMKISDMNTWISAAMTNLETCLDGLKEMESTVIDQVSARVHKSEEGMSNTLAILSNLQKLQGKFGLTMP